MIIINYNHYNSFWPIARRHWRTSWGFLNFIKLANVALSKFHEISGKTRLTSRPYFIKIEPTNKCMLRCSGCLHAKDRAGQVENFPLGDMAFGLFENIISQLEKYLVKVSLYSEGEPLLYPKIGEMVKYLTDRNIASVISSNFNYLTPELAMALVKNKLTHLIICLDGYDGYSYKKYREGGDFDRVIANIKMIQAEKKKQNSRLPYLEVQAIKLAHFTQTDIAKIKRIATDLDADFFLVKDDLAMSYADPRPQNKRCFWLYSSPQFKWNGIVQPCCYYYNDPANEFGNANETDLPGIWNNRKYQAARRYFKTGVQNSEASRCYKCNFFKK